MAKPKKNSGLPVQKKDLTLSQFSRLEPEEFEGFGLMKPTFEDYLRDLFTPEGIRDETVGILKSAVVNLEGIGSLLTRYNDPHYAVELTLREMTDLIDTVSRLRRILVEVGLKEELINLPRAADAVGMSKAGVSKWRDDPLVSHSWN